MKISCLIYKTLMRSVIEYACFIGSSFTKADRQALETMQNDALRIVFKVNKMEVNTKKTILCDYERNITDEVTGRNS